MKKFLVISLISVVFLTSSVTTVPNTPFWYYSTPARVWWQQWLPEWMDPQRCVITQFLYGQPYVQTIIDPCVPEYVFTTPEGREVWTWSMPLLPHEPGSYVSGYVCYPCFDIYTLDTGERHFPMPDLWKLFIPASINDSFTKNPAYP